MHRLAGLFLDICYTVFMCGAFSIRISPFETMLIKDAGSFRHWKPIYNARPGEVLPIITQEQPTKMTEAIWQFVPHWMKDPSKGVINARAESVQIKPFFRTAFQSQRCIIPADGFYEWAKKGTMRTPYFFHRQDDKPFAFAGLYSELPDGSGNVGFAIITTEPNSLVGRVHNRMPVMLEDGESERWLDTTAKPKDVAALLDAYPAEQMGYYAVSLKVNNARNKGAEIIQPIQ